MTIIVNNAGGFNNVGNSWGFSSTAGRILVSGCSVRNWNQYYTPKAGWSLLAQRNNNPNPSPNAFCAGRFAIAGETTMGGSGFSGNQTGACIEFTGGTLGGYIDGGFTAGTSGTATAPAVTPLGPCIVIGFFASEWPWGNWTAVAGWTKVSCDCPPQSESDWPRTMIGYKVVDVPSGSYAPQASGSSQWSATTIAVYEAGGGPRSSLAGIIG